MLKKKSGSRFWVQLLCWILIAMTIFSAIIYSVYALLGML